MAPAASVRQFVQQGARVVIVARNIDKLKAAIQEIDPSGQSVSYYSADLTDQASVERLADEIIQHEGLPDIVVNSAGAGEWLSLEEATPSHFIETINSPYLVTALTCKVFYDRMQQRGNGHFILLNSVACYFSFPRVVGYGPARWAMLGLARSLQADLNGTDFKVSMIALGKVQTPYFVQNARSEDRIPKVVKWLVPTMTEETAGRVVVRTAKSRRKIVNRPWQMAIFIELNRFFPGIFRWLTRIG